MSLGIQRERRQSDFRRVPGHRPQVKPNEAAFLGCPSHKAAILSPVGSETCEVRRLRATCGLRGGLIRYPACNEACSAWPPTACICTADSSQGKRWDSN